MIEFTTPSHLVRLDNYMFFTIDILSIHIFYLKILTMRLTLRVQQLGFTVTSVFTSSTIGIQRDISIHAFTTLAEPVTLKGSRVTWFVLLIIEFHHLSPSIHIYY